MNDPANNAVNPDAPVILLMRDKLLDAKRVLEKAHCEVDIGDPEKGLHYIEMALDYVRQALESRRLAPSCAAPALLHAASLVVDRWARGDLAQAVRMLDAAVAEVKGGSQ